MEWTRDKPTVAGWHWWGRGKYVRLLYLWRACTNCNLVAYNSPYDADYNTDPHARSAHLMGGWWMGPISEPEGPEPASRKKTKQKEAH